MILRSIAQIVLVVLTLCNGLVLKNQHLTKWINQTQSHYATAPAGPIAVPLLTPAYQPVPTKLPTATALATPAKAALIYDRNAAQVLAAKNAQSRLPIASLTKLMTVLVIARDHRPNEIVTVPALPALESDLTVVGIKPGQHYQVSDLLTATLVGSAADAATALAIWDSGSESTFITKMNQYAANWQLHNTHYATVVGLDNPNNYSSAQDLTTITQILLTHPELAAAVNTKQATIADTAGHILPVTTTNELLSQPTIYGVKTGTTAQAGQCFIGLYKDPHKQIITVVLNSPDRFAETLALLHYSNSDFTWI